MSSPDSLRDYGYANSTPVGKPTARFLADGELTRSPPACPNCGCEQICEIKVKVRQKLLAGGVGVGRYLGCPACPWASPMVIISESAPGGEP